MMAPDDLYPLATAYNCTIVQLHPRVGSNFTVLPLKRDRTTIGPAKVIFIAFLNDFPHFVRVDCYPDGPMPPVHRYWYLHRDESVVGWDAPYHERIEAWNSMLPPPPPNEQLEV